jgi:FtsH-binding integral membrane protein
MDQFGNSQPAWISASTAEMEVRERAFFRSVYGWMFAGLALTTVAAFGVVSSVAMQQLIFGTPLRWVLFIAQIGLVIFLGVRINRMSAGAAAFTFLAYSLLTGLTLSAVFLVYTGPSIVSAFASASAMFGGMAIYGAVTKRDLTSWGSFFMMGLIGVILLSLLNMFMRSDGLNFTIGLVGVFVFLGLTAYDNQKLKAYAHAGGATSSNLAIYGALQLYLDFINLFLMLLRLFGRRR